jgi:beta-glucosidase
MIKTNKAIILLGTAAAVMTLAGGMATARSPVGYRDLNHNGRLDRYEDRRQPVAVRMEDLLARMTPEEKIGSLLHGSLRAADSEIGRSSKGYDLAAARQAIGARHVTSFITRLTVDPAELARQNNAIQRLAEGTRLGIPVTISTDPRHHFHGVLGASSTGGGFSQWPETLGFAAIGDAGLVRQFGAIARREYRAVGIHMALSPQADLATEPRWPRGNGTFGSDPATVSALAGAYVQGFQGGAAGLAPGGVATVLKHWVGYGAQPEGFDAHNHYGRFARLSDRSFTLHVAAFRGALDAKAAGVMPAYPILQGVQIDGTPLPPVAPGFNKPLIEGLLRGREGYRGLVLSDWAVTVDCPAACSAPTAANPQTPGAIATPWGVEALSPMQRYVAGIDAGIDQFGGVDDPAPLLAAWRAGQIAPARLDAAVRRVLTIKFQLGLFDDPYVDPAAATRVVGDAASRAAGEAAQRRALVLLENRGDLLPLRARRVWLHGVDATAARAAGLTPVDDPAQAEAAIVRVATPSEMLHPHHFFGSRQHEGRLDFRVGDKDYEAIRRAADTVPTLVVVDMDRPAILTNVKDKARAILVAFGAGDAAVLDVVTGLAVAQGRLPYELPSSMTAVSAQDPALPDDSAGPLYRRGAGIVR